ncbi:hypothetical protein ACFROC_04985 [Nocardia tengchongensis]|uniref:hypothetical protein n=1 Tax=Nocardia tengchongensis TaxID=2055889 RepID=UPI0036C81D5B
MLTIPYLSTNALPPTESGGPTASGSTSRYHGGRPFRARSPTNESALSAVGKDHPNPLTVVVETVHAADSAHPLQVFDESKGAVASTVLWASNRSPALWRHHGRNIWGGHFRRCAGMSCAEILTGGSVSIRRASGIETLARWAVSSPLTNCAMLLHNMIRYRRTSP